MDAAQLATPVVSSLRNGRSRGAGLREQARAARAALTAHARADQFVTGQLLQVDLTTGLAQMVNSSSRPKQPVHGQSHPQANA